MNFVNLFYQDAPMILCDILRIQMRERSVRIWFLAQSAMPINQSPTRCMLSRDAQQQIDAVTRDTCAFTHVCSLGVIDVESLERSDAYADRGAIALSSEDVSFLRRWIQKPTPVTVLEKGHIRRMVGWIGNDVPEVLTSEGILLAVKAALEVATHASQQEAQSERSRKIEEIVFERAETAVSELRSLVETQPLLFVAGGAQAGRTAISNAFRRKAGERFRIVTPTDLTRTQLEAAAEIEAAIRTAYTLRENDLARLLGALLVAIVEQTGVSGAPKEVAAMIAGTADPKRAVVAHYVQSFMLNEDAHAAWQLLAQFMDAAQRLSATLSEQDLVVFLPFESLSQILHKSEYAAFWRGLGQLAYELRDSKATRWSKVRLVVLAEWVPLALVGGNGGQYGMVVAIPPLTTAEVTSALRCCGISEPPDGRVRNVMRFTAGVPVLVAAFLNYVSDVCDEHPDNWDNEAWKLMKAGIEMARSSGTPQAKGDQVLANWYRRIQAVRVPTAALREYLRFAGRTVHLHGDIDCVEFQSLFRAGLVWFLPDSRKGLWTSLSLGEEFDTAQRAAGVECLLEEMKNG